MGERDLNGRTSGRDCVSMEMESERFWRGGGGTCLLKEIH